MKTSTGKPTKEQAARFRAMKLDTGCVCCHKMALESPAAEIHHLGVGKRTGHDATIALCSYHHRNNGKLKQSQDDLRKYGPALSCGSKLFHQYFGSDEKLLEFQNRLLGISE